MEFMGWRATTAGGDGREVTSGRVTGTGRAGGGEVRSGQVAGPPVGTTRTVLECSQTDRGTWTGAPRPQKKTKIMLKPPPGDHCGPKVARAAVRAARRPAQY